jgi:hypothetical protein
MSATISDQYRKIQQELHENPNYGIASLHFAPLVADLIQQTSAKSVLITARERKTSTRP